MFIFVIILLFMDRTLTISGRHFSGLGEYNYTAHIRRPGLRPWWRQRLRRWCAYKKT